MSDCEDVRKRALLVEDIDDEFDPSVPPSTGQEYIQRVVWEAARCEEVAVAAVKKPLTTKQTFLVNNLPGCVAAPVEYAPTKEWQQLQVSNFSSLRQRLARCRKNHLKHPPPVKLPPDDNYQAWYKMCFGRSIEDGEEEDTGKDEKSKVLPLLSIVTAIPHPVVEKMLEYEVEWLSGSESSLSHDQGCWLYALLAALELPLTPDTCSLLRNLARSCSQIRAKLDKPDHPDVAALNLFICLVAKYFRQNDLADE
ncbi:gem-associated protein 2 [Ischnura elegans]|uniref:gem-associated protein 2 n=1 Tax=Ischnura elegans TaxID=197161 RepID=UPI001ED8A2AC|nr:gem-associated protein 2 [Ischnura elegans]